jgi:hypothetical protein
VQQPALGDKVVDGRDVDNGFDSKDRYHSGDLTMTGNSRIEI